MTMTHMAVAFELPGLPAVEKLALLHIANSADQDGRWRGDLTAVVAFTGLKTISHEVRSLIDRGILCKQAGGGFLLDLGATTRAPGSLL